MAKIRKAVFRSGIVMLSLLAAVVLSSSVAQAQECFAFQSSPTTVRAEGMTEAVGGIQLQCRAQEVFGQPPIGDEAVISIQLNTDITNPTNADNIITADGDGMYGLTYGNPTLGNAGDYTGDGKEVLSDGNTITWTIPTSGDGSITFPTSATGETVTIGGIIANAAALGDGGEITAVVSVNGVVVEHSPIKLADVMSGLAVKATMVAGLQCAVSVAMTMSTITIQEGFRTAITNDDSLVVAFAGIPAGVTVMVPMAVDEAMDDTETADTNEMEESISLALMQTADVDTDGVGNIEEGMGAVVLSDTGAGKVTYTIGNAHDSTTSPAVSANEWVKLKVYLSWEAGMPMLGTGSVTVSFSPQPNDDNDNIPRFAASMGSSTVIEIGECATSLLFPFVTNMHGFDTGIALTNTSAADGPCTISYSGNDMAPADDQEVTVMAGKTATFGVNMMAPGFQGFIQAECEFQNAQGFAFITNGFGSMGGPTAAQGYLAIQEIDEFE